MAVVDLSNTGIEVHMSYDGGRTFSTGREAISGDWPGRDDPSCELGTAVAQRQRVIKSPRAAWDRDGRLHVVGAFSTPDGISATASGSVGTLAGGEARVMHAVSADGGRSFSRPDAVAPSTEQQWAPAIAALPGGGVAVSFLQTAQVTSYDAVVAVLGPGARAFGTPLLLSDGHGPLPPAMEAVGNAPCYGIGDYTGLAPTSDGVVAAWPTTVGVETSFLDSDIAVREVHALAR